MNHRHVALTLVIALSIILSQSYSDLITSSSGQIAEKTEVLGLDDEADLILERVRLYLQRHGDNGRIDPERRLSRIRTEYERRLIIQAEQGISPQGVPGTNWVSLGPTNGAGRAIAIAAHPTIPETIYIGAADGGVWRTTDGGSSWVPLTDSLNDLSVGALALAPSSPNVVYLGTGEGGYAGDFVPGIGFLKSTDGGNTWILPSSVIASKFYRILVHPTNPQELVIGTNAGGLLSTDGGDSWRSVIDNIKYQDVTDIVRHPTKPQILYATSWDAFRWCARIGSCSISSPVVLKSTDGGATWIEKKSGLAASTTTLRVNRASIAISPSNPSVLYLSTSILDSNTGDEVSHIYKSTDAAESWADLAALASNTNTAISHYLGSQGWYDNTIVVSPSNENVVIAGGVRYVRSREGGATWELPQLAPSIHVDAHDLRYVGSSLYIANDGGIYSSPDDGNTVAAHNAGLVTRQYYAMTNDPVNRNRIFAGSQDNGTDRRSDTGGTSWTPVIGSDGFECAVNPAVPSIAYGTIQAGILRRTKEAGVSGAPRFFDITPPYSSGESGPFYSVLTLDANTPSTLYTVSNRVWRTTDGGDSWEPLPTTTTDGSTWARDAFGINALAVSRSDSSILMVAKANFINNTTIRNIFRSSNGGTTWVRATTGLPTDKGVLNLEIDPKNPNIAYAALSGTTGVNVYQTVDGGASWSPQGMGLPPFSAQVVRVDPTDSNVIYCGTDVGVYRSTNQGVSWESFGAGLPSSSVNDIQILDDGSILRVATHGRGVWELEVPSSGNTPPTATISSPSAAMTIAKGTTVNFSGSSLDADANDSVTGMWTFPDTWESIPAGGGTSNVSHTFNGAGVFPVSLTVKDSRGALGSASVTISVPEPNDSCSTPAVIPGDGPFPFSVKLNNEAAGTQTSDPAPSCVSTNSGRSSTVWFGFAPVASGDYEFSTCGSSVNTVLSLWTGPLCGPYTAVSNGCNNDAPTGSNCSGVGASSLTVSANAGQALRIMVSGLSTLSTGTFTLTVRKIATPDFSLSFNSTTVTADRGTKAVVEVLINRTGGFSGNVTLTLPDSLPAGVKPKPPDPIATTGNNATFKLKIKGGAVPGAYQLTLTGRDDSGRARTATVTLVVQ